MQLNAFVMFALACLASGLLTGVTIWLARLAGWELDKPDSVQSVHRHWAPRIGGVGLAATLGLGLLFFHFSHEGLLILLCGIPAFACGMLEDIKDGSCGPRWRLLATFVSAWLGWYFLDARLTGVDVPGFDWLLANWVIVSFLFTAFAVGGVAHSLNIIDGFNGLAACTSLIAFAAYYIVACIVGDELVQQLSLLFCGALLGFLAWNFPFGRIFLGDGGAYLLGFGLGELSVLLVTRNPQVSPWFCLVVLAYPIVDTLFSYYRREVVRGVSWSEADALHLHHLIYRRIVKPATCNPGGDVLMSNSVTSVYLWGLSLMSAIPALLFWDNTLMLWLVMAAFVVSYVTLYARLTRFRAPRMLSAPLRKPVAVERYVAPKALD